RVRVAREFEGAEQVDLEDLPPFVFGVVDRGPGQVAAGVVDQDVQAFALVLHPVEQLAALLVVGDVGDQRAQVAVRVLLEQVFARDFKRIAVARGDQHARAEAQQLGGDRAADAGAAARDQGELSVEAPARPVHAAHGMQKQSAMAFTGWPSRAMACSMKRRSPATPGTASSSRLPARPLRASTVAPMRLSAMPATKFSNGVSSFSMYFMPQASASPSPARPAASASASRRPPNSSTRPRSFACAPLHTRPRATRSICSTVWPRAVATLPVNSR